MDKYEKKVIKDIKIKTFGSTDRGVSFLLMTNKVNIFHAGDLNWWHWENDTKAEQKQEEINFKEEIAKIKNENIDIAFIPVDPRLKEYYYLAGEYFIQKVAPDYMVPIHFSNNFEITREFVDKIKELDTKIFVIENRGQKIEIID